MRVQFAPELIKKLKKQNVRIRKHFEEVIDVFSQNPNDLQLNNHKLHREWEGFRSIDVTADWRAIFQEIQDKEEAEPIAYFVALGTHNQLYT